MAVDPGKPTPGGGLADLAKALSGGKNIPPPPTSTKTKNTDQLAISMFKKNGPNWIKTGYYQTVLAYAHQYGIPATYLAALLLTENANADPNITNSAGATGLAQIKDTTLANFNKGKTLTWGQGNSLGTGAVITKAMKQNPVFAIAYAAWRLSGGLDTYGSLDAAYNQGYNPGYTGKISKLLPSGYVPSKADYTPSPLNKKIQGAPISHVTDPFVIYNKKTGKITTTIDPSNKNIVEFEGFPITVSTLKQQLQDKNGLGGDVYSLTGQTPTLSILAGLMSSGKTTQQIENALINSKFFMSSPTGKKYSLSYQGVYQGIMGADAKNPANWGQMVRNAAKNNLTTDEFAVQIRNSPDYVHSNEFKTNQSSFTDSYEKIYGALDVGGNAKRLASDAALAGWSSQQWEHYLRSQPEYVKTKEYKSHALDILSNLGLMFGFTPSLKPQTNETPGMNPSPGAMPTADAAPAADSRIKGLARANPVDATQGLGINY